MRSILILSLLFSGLFLYSCSKGNSDFHLTNDIDYLREIEPVSNLGYVNIVIEIPAGDNAKWEVEKSDGSLVWEQIGDSLRVINYLPYPANYGMVPQTLLPIEDGGDDDPIDIFLLGPARERGSIAEGIIIGAIKMLDRGEQDDKLIAVDPESWFGSVRTMVELDEQFPGVSEILKIWIENYKGEGLVEITGYMDVFEATALFEHSIESFAKSDLVNPTP